MRFLLLSAAVLSALSAKIVLYASPGKPDAAVAAATGALAELQRGVGSAATVAAAAGAAGRVQEAAFSKATAAATETPAGVRVRLASGKVAQLRNLRLKNDEQSSVTYHYRAAEPKTGLVWVSMEPYECQTELLVSRASGLETDIGNEPHINANGTLLFARQNDCFKVSEDLHPGFGLWRVQRGQLKLLKRVRLDHYFVLAGRWVGPGKLRLELGSLAELMDKGGEDQVRRQAFELMVKE